MTSLPHVEFVRSPRASVTASDALLHETEDLPRQGEWLIYHFITERASVRVLQASGFERIGDARAVEGGHLWRWRLERATESVQ